MNSAIHSRHFNRAVSLGAVNGSTTNSASAEQPSLILHKNDTDGMRIGRPVVKALPDSDWLLYYTTKHSSSDVCAIHVGDSSDGVVWRTGTNDVQVTMNDVSPVGCVLRNDSESIEWYSFDAATLSLGDVTPVGGDGSFLMLYDGGDSEVFGETHMRGLRKRVGLAVSSDGRLYGRCDGSEPTGAVLDNGAPGEFDYFGPEAPRVTITGKSELRLFYHARSDPFAGVPRIGVALSSDGISFTRPDEHNPVLCEGRDDDIDAKGCSHPHVVRMQEGRWLMAYTAYNANNVAQIALAISDDGLSFQKLSSSVPALAPTFTENTFDESGVTSPYLVPMASSWRLYYIGQQHALNEERDDGFGEGAGLALGAAGIPNTFTRRTGTAE